MNANEIWSAICELSLSQGLYGRIKRDIIESGRKDEILAELENQHFVDRVDMVLFFET